MKHIKLIIILLSIRLSSCSGDSDDFKDHIELTPPEESEIFVNIPDPVFKKLLLNAADINKDNEISISEARAATWFGENLNPTEKIKDITGLEEFINLENFVMNAQHVEVFDFTNNKKLKTIQVYGSNAKILKLPYHPELTVLEFNNGQLEELDLSGCVNLVRVDVPAHRLKKLNVTSCIALDRLWFYDNELTKVDLLTNINLRNIVCHSNNLEELDVSNLKSLEDLSCRQNENLKFICVYDLQYAMNQESINDYFKPDDALWAVDCK